MTITCHAYLAYLQLQGQIYGPNLICISNRDSNAIRVLNALIYPQVKFYSNNITIFSDKIKFEGELEFHGKKINKTIESNFTQDENSIKIEGKFSIVLTDFDIKLPSLMLVKMEDFADLNFKLIFYHVTSHWTCLSLF